jgi:ribosomal protein S18 acetylase RimI-like enzyme
MEYIFERLKNDDLPILIKTAKDIIQNYYITFLGKKIVNEYINSNHYKKEIIENIENCVVMKLNGKIIGFSIIQENKIHLMMIDAKYQNKNHGSVLLEFIENKLFIKYPKIELQSFAYNTIANSFYTKNGWKVIEEINTDGLILFKYNKTNNGKRTNGI